MAAKWIELITGPLEQKKQMGDSRTDPTRSLIQQRLELQRRRAILIVALVLQVLGAAMYLAAIAFSDRDWFWWVGVVVLGAAIALTMGQFRRVRRDTLAFEESHGTDAGKQSDAA